MTQQTRQCVAALLAPLLVALGACSGGTSGGPNIPRDRIEDELRAASCRAEVRCEQSPDLETCLSVTGEALRDGVAAQLTAGKIAYDPAGGKKLIDYIDSVTCLRSDRESLASLVESFTRQREAFRGTLALGAVCSLDEACLSGQCEFPADCGECCVGKCATVPPPVPRGSECGYDVASCELDSTCGRADATTQRRTCEPLVAIGGACERGILSFPCVAGASCVGQGGATTCQAFPATAEPCELLDGPRCDDIRDYCNLDRHVCERHVAIGGACAPLTLCVPDAHCDTTSNTCVARGRVGDACAEPNQFPEDCLGGLLCDPTKKCAPWPLTPPPMCP